MNNTYDFENELGYWINKFHNGINGKGWSRIKLLANPNSPIYAICKDECTNKYLKLYDEWESFYLNIHPSITPEILIEDFNFIKNYDKNWYSFNPNITYEHIIKFPNGIMNNEWNPIQLNKRGKLKKLYCDKRVITKDHELWKSRGFSINWKLILYNPNGFEYKLDMKWISLKNGAFNKFVDDFYNNKNKNKKLEWNIASIICNNDFNCKIYMKILNKSNNIKYHLCHKDLTDEDDINYRITTIPLFCDINFLNEYLKLYFDICHPKFIENLKYNYFYSIF